ncbi:MAG: hypothetical protein QOG53_311 [Frankiales bacterium]|jgi:hypothetical protein|nr:hypothetical protein [Frankiales bacterium]
MNDTTTPVSDDTPNDWVTKPDEAVHDTVDDGSGQQKHKWGRQFGLVAAGVLVGGIAVAGLQNHSAAQATPQGPPTGQQGVPGQQGPGPGLRGGPPGQQGPPAGQQQPQQPGTTTTT